MFKSIFTVAFCLIAVCAFAAEAEFPGIETLMTDAERQSAGIDSLSPAQLDALNAWIATYTGAVVATTNSQPAAVAAPPVDDFRAPPEKIDYVSRIAGEFNGWSGRTRFTLENGQVWEQRRGNRWKITLDNPEVRIYQNFLGAFEMEVISEGRSIGVRRIR